MIDETQTVPDELQVLPEEVVAALAGDDEGEIVPIEELRDGEVVTVAGKELVAPIWERQPGERDKPYNAFKLYRDLGPEKRGFEAVARVIWNVVKTPGKSSGGRIRQWCAEWVWRPRVEAWDRYQDRLYLQARAAAIKEMAERHIGIAKLMEAKGYSKIREIGELVPIDVDQAIRLVVEGVKIERLSYNQPTENTKSVTDVTVVTNETDVRELLRRRLMEMRTRAAEFPRLTGGVPEAAQPAGETT